MAYTEWAELCRRCFIDRYMANEFMKEVNRRGGVNGQALAKAFVDTRSEICPPNDPLPPRYLEILLASHTVSVEDILLASIARYNSVTRAKQTTNPTIGDLKTLQYLTSLLASAKVILDRQSSEHCLLLVAKWVMALAKLSASEEYAPTSTMVETVGSLLATLCASAPGPDVLSEKAEGQENVVANSVGSAIATAAGAFPAISAQLVNRLSEVQKHIAMFSQQGSAEIQALQFQANVPELQVIAARSGTTALLQERLSTGQTVGDNPVFNFLAGRHANDYSSMFLDLLLAAFHLQKESQKHVLQQVELYIRNRLPATLATISQSSFESFSAEQALLDAWPNLPKSPCAQRFLHACSLHGLIAPEKAAELIDDQELSAKLAKSLYAKDEVVTQISSSLANAERLLKELLHGEANGMVISQAFVEIMVSYARRKETHHLKDLGNILLQKPDFINALALFHQPHLWITPLCTLLDEWKWDDIHSESQPIYDEFGTIFLLVITAKRRLGHTATKLGIDGFVARYLDQEGVEKPISTLSADMNDKLGDWIEGLYIADSLSDDVTTKCSSKDFYMLVPTLLRQSVMAYEAGKLNQDDLKGGLEYLLEPFLLPSLVTALQWASSYAAAGAVVIPILTRDSDSEIHKNILTMMRSPADFVFRRLDLKKTDLASLQKNATTAVTSPGADLSLRHAVAAHGGFAVLQCLLDVLLSFSGSNDFVFALDLIATLICLGSLRNHLYVRYTELGRLLADRDTMSAEAIVHLYRRTEAYNSVLIVEDVSMEIADLPDVTTGEEATVPHDATVQPVDDIDQVLNESAAMNAIDTSLDVGLDDGMDQMDGLDSFYLPDDDNMGLGNLDDLDLDMF